MPKPPEAQTKRVPISIVCASDTKTMATYAKPGIDEFDVRAQIAKWSLEIQAGEKAGYVSALTYIYNVAENAIGEIFRFSEKGNSGAVKMLHNFFAVFVPKFDDFCHEHPEFYEPFARKMTHWPAMISRHADSKKRNEKLIALLNLGADSGLNLDG
ncbi:MAG TPA: hypothetical protein VMB22_03850, partial [Verrucomicrobiae bacterium]|nr:hypothetical protein [Verrucomicrobiae bacterium]